ncbi:hypothetical protein [Lagierella massiliensis]|uniref:hypothetical protein n=1 Tax=Lagierella massiliensis TaxID=1689303 RepID=UPI0006D80844|nr:hypothetical protein [Lagierella massiliensis]
MNLRKYEGENIIVELNNKKIYIGKVTDFIFAEDNNPQKNSIIIEARGCDNLVEIYEDDVKKIDIMN